MTAARDLGSPYLTLDEAAAYLRVDDKTLRRHVMREMPPLSIGRRKFYTREMLDQWHDRTRGGSSGSVTASGTSDSRRRTARASSDPRVKAMREKLRGSPPKSTPDSSSPETSHPEPESILPPASET